MAKFAFDFIKFKDHQYSIPYETDIYNPCSPIYSH